MMSGRFEMPGVTGRAAAVIGIGGGKFIGRHLPIRGRAQADVFVLERQIANDELDEFLIAAMSVDDHYPSEPDGDQ